MSLFSSPYLLHIALGAALVSCSDAKFQRGSPAIARPEISCLKNDKIQGLNFLVVVDNSSSQADNDCPGKKLAGYDSKTGGPKYTCQTAPEREKAINNGFEFLSSYELDHPGFESQFSVLTFPAKASTNDGFDIQTGTSEGLSEGWVRATVDNAGLIENAARQATRNPFGLTPFSGGIEGATQVFSKISSENKLAKIVFFITDGFPTDENAALAKEKARTLRKSLEDGGAAVDRVITLLVGQGSTSGEVQASKLNAAKIMQGLPLFGGLGRSQDNVNELLGLGSFANDGLVEVLSDRFLPENSISQIQNVLQDQIQRAVECK